MANRLIDETSPYLLQHAHNPVDWYPWGDEAFRKASEEQKPVFLSIGYSACHWCHVMERESFENEETAALLNRDFIPVKVDREERPEVDAIYMQAVQMMTGHGGWPMSMFLTPEGAPFFGGTYFPPEDRHGMPGFPRVLEHVARIWNERREAIDEAAREMRESISRSVMSGVPVPEITAEMSDAAAHAIAGQHDRVHGGFGGAPKFPAAMSLEFLLQVGVRTGDASFTEIVTRSLETMARGGIYDHLGGGFARYSVDERWLVPHFEKMLYDNALLARLYVHAWQETRREDFARVARETLGFVLREMTSPEGGFYSALDADSEGEEGKYYVWRLEEILEVLGPDEGRIFATVYDVRPEGNWEGVSILNLPRTRAEVAADLGRRPETVRDIAERGRKILFDERQKRVRPARDDKVLAGWNGWMLAAFAEAAIAFGDERYLRAARANADFLIETFFENGRLSRSFKDGRVRFDGVLEDYGGVAWGLIAAFEATQDRRYLDVTREILGTVIERFRDEDNGAFFDVSDDHEKLIARPKEIMDNATPSGNALVIASLFRVGRYLEEPRLEEIAHDALAHLMPVATRYPSGFGFLLSAAEWITGRPLEIAITGSAASPGRAALLRAVGETYLPQRIIVSDAATELPLMRDRPAEDDVLWICEMGACRAPVRKPAQAKEALLEARRRGAGDEGLAGTRD
jgi:uncharacterized protein